MSADWTGLHVEGIFSSEREKYVRPENREPDPLGAHGPFLSSLFSILIFWLPFFYFLLSFFPLSSFLGMSRKNKKEGGGRMEEKKEEGSLHGCEERHVWNQ